MPLDNPPTRRPALPVEVALAVGLAVALVGWVTWTGSDLPVAVAGVVPAAVAAVLLVAAGTSRLPQPLRRWWTALLVAPAAAGLSAVLVAVVGEEGPDLLTSAAQLLVPAVAATGLVLLLPRRAPVVRPRALVATLGVLAVVAAGAGSGASTATAAVEPGSCLDGGPVDKTFAVSALDVDVTVDKFGDHDPKGKMYALTSRVAAVRQQERARTVSTGLRDDAIQPLVIRANEGDCVEIRYTNSATGGDYGIHLDGLEFAMTSSGDAVGSNPASGAAPGQTRTYRFSVPGDKRFEGAHYLHPGPGFRAAVDHGLFGTLVVEPPGSTYWDPSRPGTPLESGWEAIIKPGGVDADCVPRSDTPTCGFREGALLHHEIGNDNEQLTSRSGALVPLVDSVTGSYRPGSFALNYRSEPFRNRLLAFPKEKSHAYSSYTFGDPATPVMRGYLGDPTKLRIIHVGAEKFHVFHLHGGGDRWRADPLADPTQSYADTGLDKDSDTKVAPSQRLDSQSMGPGESFNLEIEGGAGGLQQSAGDFLYHCHIAKHYTSGMWGLWRVFDTLQPDLVPLADRTEPPAAVDSRDLVGRTIDGTTITAANLDDWVRQQLPPSGVPRDGQDATVMDWKVQPTATGPLYLGAPADPTSFADSPKVVAGQPNLLAVDAGHVVGGRPTIWFNPVNGRPAYPLLRTTIGKRPPFATNGHSGTPWLGADADQAPSSAADPWASRPDGLCPQGRRLRTFNVVAIGKSIPRSPGVTDPQGKVFVLAHDKAATLADANAGEPLALRANQGDCVAVTLTTEIPDSSAFDNFSKNTMHIHHVQFDVQGSDGVSAGFAYEHSVRPYRTGDATLTAAVPAGATRLPLSAVTRLVGTDANGSPTHPWVAVGEGLESIEVRQVESVDTAAKTVTLRSPLAKDHAAGEFAGTEFVQYRWYPDVLLDNVFWHDHVDGIHGWGHGLVGQLIVEPPGSTYHDPVTGREVDSGSLVDIHTSSPLAPGLVDGSFRELALWAVNDNDKGDFSTFNLRANPLATRLDKANQFSSWRYGDPVTPLPRLYPGDPLVIRAVNVSPTVDTLHVQGARTVLQPRLAWTSPDGSTEPLGTLLDTVHYGVSEKYTLVLGGSSAATRLRPGDYLYSSGANNRTQQGAWGLVRVLPGRVPDLRPLPGGSPPSQDYVPPVSTGAAPPVAADPGNPCPADAAVRRFDLSAVDRSATFAGARTGWVPTVDADAVKRKLKPMVPLVMHAVAGDCLKVTVRNQLTTRVSFAVGEVDRELGSGGVNAGFDPDTTVAPGATRTYVLHLDDERIGVASVADLAGGSSTLKAGLYGALVVAPASRVPGQQTELSDPVTGEPQDLGAQVLVHVPGADVPDYRDQTLLIADDDPTIGQDFMPYPTSAVAGRSLLNYGAAAAGDGNAAFRNPGSGPVLTSYAGDPLLVHALVTPGSENTHVLGLGGMAWPEDPFVPDSNVVTASGLGPWESVDAQVVGGAGGTAQQPGDWFVGDVRRPFTQAGVWGLERVLDPAQACPVRRVDGSLC